MKKALIAVAMMVLMAGCETVKLPDMPDTPAVPIPPTTTTTVPPVVTPPPVVVPSAELWPAYRFDKYFGHGYASENIDRDAAIAACIAEGKNCIRCKGGDMKSDEVAVWLLHWRSPKTDNFEVRGKNAYDKALKRGVSRYQIEITASQATRWKDLVKDYPPDTVQFLTDDVEAVRKIITTRPVLKK